MKFTTHIAAVVALVLATAASAAAQAGWGTTPDTLSAPQPTGGAIGAPRVDVDAAGNAFALWSEPGLTPFGPGSTVRTARFDVATRTWSSPLTLSGAVRAANAVDIAVDAAGNALALWTANPISVSLTLGAARYDAATGQWTSLAFGAELFQPTLPTVAMSDDGDAVVCWVALLDALSCRRYAAVSNAWSAAERLGALPTLVDAALDAAGNIQVVMVGLGVVQTARFDASSATWSAVSGLATQLPAPSNPGAQVAMNEAGDAVATWSRGSVLEVSRYPAGATGWTAATVLSVDGLYNEGARAVVDPAGAITVAWVHTNGSIRTIQVSRYDPLTMTWSPAADLPGQGTSAYGPAGIDSDALGNVHVTWSQSLVSPQIRLLAARYAVSTGQWTTETNLSALGQSAANSDVAVDRHGNAMTVWFQQASGFSAPQALRWDAAPAAPTVTSVAPASTTLSVAFTIGASADPGLTPTTVDYSLDGGVTWITRTPAGIASPLVLSGLTDGVAYSVRLRAVSSAGPGTASSNAVVRSGVDTAPSGLRVVSLAGTTLTLAWREPAGLEPSGYLLEGGVAPGQTLASVSLGTAGSLAIVTVPVGTFHVRIVAVSGATRGGTSNEVRIAVGVADPPSSPTGLLGLVNGSNVALSWTNTLSGGAPSSVVLNVSGPVTTGLSLPLGESFSFANVPSGTYTFTVAAVNAAGASAPSAPVRLTFPGACSGVPAVPPAFSASVSGNIVSLAWESPESGPAATGYVLSVGGAFTGTLPVSGRTFASAVGAGSYAISVAATNACGVGVATPPRTLVVP